jgi:hypothetical protein
MAVFVLADAVASFVPQMKDKNRLRASFLPISVLQSEDSGPVALVSKWPHELQSTAE